MPPQKPPPPLDLVPLLDRAGVGVYRTTLDGRILQANQAIADMLGYPDPATLLARNAGELWAEPRARREMLPRVEATGEAREQLLHMRHADGRVLQVMTTVRIVRAESGEVTFEGLLRDVTGERRSRARLAASERRFRALVEQSFDGIALVDAEGRFLYVAPSVERILGYAPEELLWRRSEELVWDDPAGRRAAFAAIAATPGASVVSDLEYRRRDGSRCVLETVRRNLLDDPAVQAIVVNFRDVTSEREAREEERRARAEAEEANRAKDAFLATLSHELRSPVSAVLTWARLARSGRLDGATAARALETIERNAKLQVRLIDDLLDASRITAGRLELEVADVEVETAVAAAIDSVRSAAEARRMRIVWSSEGEPATVRGDDARLQQVFSNLLTNAVKFSEPGGEVRVAVRREARDVEVTVADDGIGIEPARLASIFDRFGQVDTSLSRRRGGLGLGLAIVKHLVEAHGGSVCAESAGSGRGATFRVRIPREGSGVPIEASDAAGGMAAEPPPSLDGVEVLVVDDEDDARDFAATVLARRGATVRAAASAAEALELLEDRPAQVVVTDLAMPGEDGFAFRARLREGPLRAVPVVALTALGAHRDRARVRRAAFFAHLVKPVDEAELVIAVASAAARAARG